MAESYESEKMRYLEIATGVLTRLLSECYVKEHPGGLCLSGNDTPEVMASKLLNQYRTTAIREYVAFALRETIAFAEKRENVEWLLRTANPVSPAFQTSDRPAVRILAAPENRARYQRNVRDLCTRTFRFRTEA